MGDEHPVEDGLAPGEEINFLEGAESVVADGEVEGKVDGGRGVVGGGRKGGRGKEGGGGRSVENLGGREVWSGGGGVKGRVYVIQGKARGRKGDVGRSLGGHVWREAKAGSEGKSSHSHSMMSSAMTYIYKDPLTAWSMLAATYPMFLLFSPAIEILPLPVK